MSAPCLEARNLERYLGEEESRVHVLRGVSLTLEPGTVHAIVGPSGCGKSSLLYILGLLDNPDAGELLVGGNPVLALEDVAASTQRTSLLGFVFQFHFLLEDFTAEENVMIPMRRLGKLDEKAMRERAVHLLGEVGLGPKAKRPSRHLSGGEQQRVAIARALANDPLVLLADEPTGNLDSINSERVFALLTRVVKDHRKALLLVTHNPAIAEKCDWVHEMKDGQIVKTTRNELPRLMPMPLRDDFREAVRAIVRARPRRRAVLLAVALVALAAGIAFRFDGRVTALAPGAGGPLSRLAGEFSYWGDFPTGTVPLCLLLVAFGAWRKKPALRRAGIAVLLAATVAGGCVTLCRTVLGRPRPYATAAEVEGKIGQVPAPWITLRPPQVPGGLPDGFYGPQGPMMFHGFPSGHAATSMATAAALAAALPPTAPFVAVAAAGVCWSRLYLRRHYLSDLAVGGGVGIAVGLWFGGAARRRKPSEP